MSTQRFAGMAPMYKLDAKPYADMVRRTRRLADKALQRYGEPTMSLEELRSALSRELPGVPLSEFIVKEREAGW